MYFKSFSQDYFKKGYFINESNNKIECLIEDLDWNKNPTSFKYRLSESADVKSADITSVKEFKSKNAFRYIRENIEIDVSSSETSKLSSSKIPEFENKTVFLKVLIEGEISLFLFEDNSLRRYFYQKNNSEIEQLIFKEYLNKDGTVAENNRYKQQLFNSLECTEINKGKIENLSYNKKELVNIFKSYNECVNTVYVDYKKDNTQSLFHLNFRPRLNYSSTDEVASVSNFTDTNFDGKLNFGFGVELEWLLPFNHNRWAIFTEPTYQRFKAGKITASDNIVGGFLESEIDYTVFELPLGFRRYFLLNRSASIYINCFLITQFGVDGSFEFRRADGTTISTLNIDNIINYGLGFGGKINKLTLEVRYHTRRELLRIDNRSSKLDNIALIFGYSFL